MFVFDRSVANGHNRLVDFPNGIQPHAFESPIRHPSDLCLSNITCLSPVTNIVTGCWTYSDGLLVDLKTYSDLFV